MEEEGASAPAAKPKTPEQKDAMWRDALPPSILIGPNALRIKSLQRALKKHGLEKISAMSEDAIRQLYREWRDREAPKRKALRMMKKPAGSASSRRRYDDDDDDDADGEGAGGDGDGGDDGERVGSRKRRPTSGRGAGAGAGSDAVAAAPSGKKKGGGGRAPSRRKKARKGEGDTDSDDSDSNNRRGGLQAALTSTHADLNLQHFAMQPRSGSTSDDGGDGGNLLRMESSMSILSDL